jgi:hypothetical protein
LYDPNQHVEYLSEIDEKSSTDTSIASSVLDDSDSCYDSMSDHHLDRVNLSQMNVSSTNIGSHRAESTKVMQVPNSIGDARFHSTAIHDVSQL